MMTTDVRRTSVFEFPNPVNEVAARVVAGGVLTLVLITLATGWRWLLVPLALGFLLRVAFGPRFSPLALVATRVVAPRLPSRPVPGPPKRFAQGIGATVTTSAVLLEVAGAHSLVTGLLVLMAVFATLESVVGLCVGCQIFAGLIRLGVIPDSVCERCANIWS